MTNQRPAGRVVAATSGTPASRAAIAYAAHQARERCLPLELVHVVPTYFSVGPLPTVPDIQVRRAAQDVLDRGRELATTEVPGVQVSTTLAMGSRVDALVELSQDAALLVVGAAPQGMPERVWTGSTVTGIAARADLPGRDRAGDARRDGAHRAGPGRAEARPPRGSAARRRVRPGPPDRRPAGHPPRLAPDVAVRRRHHRPRRRSRLDHRADPRSSRSG